MVDEKSTTLAPSRLARVHEGRVLAGVTTGLGRYTGIDPVVFRVGFGVLVLAHGQGIPLYVAAALLMPPRPDQAAVAEQLFRRRFDAPAVLSILGGLLAGMVALSVVGTGIIGLLGGRASTDAIAVLTVAGLIVMVAHSRGVSLVEVARALPERLQGYPPEAAPQPERVSLRKDDDVPPSGTLPDGMIDLATLSRPSPPAPPPASGKSGAYGAMIALDKGRRRAGLTSVTLLMAVVAVAALWPVAQGYPGPESPMLLIAVALAVIGCGLMAGGWFRARGLATMGTVLTCALLTTAVAAEAPPDARYGEIEWRPTDAASVQPDYKIAAGSGKLDLTGLPLKPGQVVAVNAQITFGDLTVTLPPQARVEVDARVSLGDLQVDGHTISGPAARTREVLEPRTPGAQNPPLITVHIRGRISDVQVSHG